MTWIFDAFSLRKWALVEVEIEEKQERTSEKSVESQYQHIILSKPAEEKASGKEEQ